MAQRTEAVSRLRRVELELRPEGRFSLPMSDGYPVYGALLGVLASIDEAVSEGIHDSSLGSLHSSGLLGIFGESDRPYHKTVLPKQTYRLSLGIVDPDDREVFQALVNAIVLEGDSLDLREGVFRVEEFQSENTTHEKLIDRVGAVSNPSIEMTFRTCTCLEEADEVTTMFPYRRAVFRSLLGKWNRTAPADLEFDLSDEEILGSVIEKPDPRSYETHSVLTNRVKRDDGENRNLF